MIRLLRKSRRQHVDGVRQVRRELGEQAAAADDQIQKNKERAERLRKGGKG